MVIYKTAHFRVRPECVEAAVCAVREFVAYVHQNEPRTLIYSSVQAKEDATVFLHFMGFIDAAAEEKHYTSPGVQKFTAALHPLTVEGMEFMDYELCSST